MSTVYPERQIYIFVRDLFINVEGTDRYTFGFIKIFCERRILFIFPIYYILFKVKFTFWPKYLFIPFRTFWFLFLLTLIIHHSDLIRCPNTNRKCISDLYPGTRSRFILQLELQNLFPVLRVSWFVGYCRTWSYFFYEQYSIFLFK